MAAASDIDRVWDILESHSVGMLTTQFSGGLRARPLNARPDRAAGTIAFVTDARGHKDDEIAARRTYVRRHRARTITSICRSPAGLAWRDPARGDKSGKKLDDLWWKGGPDDLNARVLTIEPVTAELWDGPSNSLVAALRIRQGEDHRRRADGWREPQDNGADGLGLRRIIVGPGRPQPPGGPTPTAGQCPCRRAEDQRRRECNRCKHVLHHIGPLADQEHSRENARQNEDAGRQIDNYQQPTSEQRGIQW